MISDNNGKIYEPRIEDNEGIKSGNVEMSIKAVGAIPHFV